MAEKKERKVVRIEEKKPAPKAPENPAAEGEKNPTEEDVKYTFGYCIRHPIKAVKHAAKEHPVATGVIGVGGVGLLAFAAKAIAEALGGGEIDTEDSDEDPDFSDDEEEDDEEEEI